MTLTLGMFELMLLTAWAPGQGLGSQEGRAQAACTDIELVQRRGGCCGSAQAGSRWRALPFAPVSVIMPRHPFCTRQRLLSAQILCFLPHKLLAPSMRHSV